MRTILKGIGKLFCALVSVLLVAVLGVGGWFGIQGIQYVSGCDRRYAYQRKGRDNPCDGQLRRV